MISGLIRTDGAALPYYLLLFIRMSGLFILSPVFGRKNVPLLLKAGFCLLLTVVLGTANPGTYVVKDERILAFILDIARELAVGLILGYLATMFFSVGLIAGQIIDVQIGLGVGSLFDPQLNTQASVTGLLLELLMILYFFLNNGHLRLIRILTASVECAPVGAARLAPDLAKLVIEQFSLCFGMAVSLMLPLIGAALLAETVLGVMMRAVPQLNAYMVGIPMKIMAGLAVLYMTQPLYAAFCEKVFDSIFYASEKWIRLMGVSA